MKANMIAVETNGKIELSDITGSPLGSGSLIRHKAEQDSSGNGDEHDCQDGHSEQQQRHNLVVKSGMGRHMGFVRPNFAGRAHWLILSVRAPRPAPAAPCW